MAAPAKRRLKDGLRRVYDAGARLYLAPLLRYEWRHPPIPDNRERMFQFEFAMRAVARHQPADLLDVGAGLNSWPDLVASCGIRVTATDEVRGYWGSMFNRHFHVIPDDIVSSKLEGQWDMVTCLGVLTCIEDDAAAVRNLFRLVKPGGHLVATFAYKENEAVPNAYELPGATYGQGFRFICRMFSRAELDGWLRDNGGELEEQELYQVFAGDYWAQGERVAPRRVGAGDLHHYTAVSIRKL